MGNKTRSLAQGVQDPFRITQAFVHLSCTPGPEKEVGTDPTDHLGLRGGVGWGGEKFPPPRQLLFAGKREFDGRLFRQLRLETPRPRLRPGG